MQNKLFDITKENCFLLAFLETPPKSPNLWALFPEALLLVGSTFQKNKATFPRVNGPEEPTGAQTSKTAGSSYSSLSY